MLCRKRHFVLVFRALNMDLMAILAHGESIQKQKEGSDLTVVEAINSGSMLVQTKYKTIAFFLAINNFI
jgi:hypothetical protein